MSITFNMVLEAEGIDPKDVRLVRHQDNRPECKISPYSLWRRDLALLERYQSLQSSEVFKVGNTLASFVRTPAGQTLFVGLYRVDGMGVSDETDVLPSSNIACPGIIKYTTSCDNRLKDMAGRLVVDWGKGFLAWVQLAAKNDKKVLELGRDPDDKPFPGYFTFGCRLSELAVEPQQVVLGKGKSADGGLGVQAAMGSMPIVSMEPSGQLGGAFV